MSRPHLVISINVDWFFLSHRLNFARRVLARGWDCTVVAADTGMADRIRAEGLGFHAVPLSRSGTNPVADARLGVALADAYRRLAPTLVHQMTIKPVLYGSLAARWVGVPVVNHITGLGYTFTSAKAWSPVRAAVRTLYRAALRGPRSTTMFENPDDQALFEAAGLVRPGASHVVRGCGVDTAAFAATPLPEGRPVAMLAARMLRDKGVHEFVEAARTLRRGGHRGRFVLVGDSDAHNPAAVPAAALEAWSAAGDVEWWGRSETMPETLAQASVVVLPSYREGLPKVLLEAAALGRPIVSADVPGCREVVAPGRNGDLVPARAAAPLADSLGALLDDPPRMAAYGAASRDRAVAEFSDDVIARQTFSVYDGLLGRAPAHA